MSQLPTILAYLDPGVGAMIIQAAAAGVLGALFTIKLWWGRFIGLFSRKSQASVATPPPPAEDSKL